MKLLSTANDWINDGHKVAIATVLKTWGSAPRRAGSQLAIRDDGHMVGSVSGGCVEGDVVANALELFDDPKVKIIDYGIEALKAIWHRGAVDADGKSGDGAGIQIEIAPDFFKEKISTTGHPLMK